ncbi:MAG: hypothetical protein JWO70_2678, partial [Betaproteobacteria bacterium]|nr:hypothetical protein [Betaproteobacteria bacterium]
RRQRNRQRLHLLRRRRPHRLRRHRLGRRRLRAALSARQSGAMPTAVMRSAEPRLASMQRRLARKQRLHAANLCRRVPNRRRGAAKPGKRRERVPSRSRLAKRRLHALTLNPGAKRRQRRQPPHPLAKPLPRVPRRSSLATTRAHARLRPQPMRLVPPRHRGHSRPPSGRHRQQRNNRPNAKAAAKDGHAARATDHQLNRGQTPISQDQTGAHPFKKKTGVSPPAPRRVVFLRCRALPRSAALRASAAARRCSREL